MRLAADLARALDALTVVEESIRRDCVTSRPTVPDLAGHWQKALARFEALRSSAGRACSPNAA